MDNDDPRLTGLRRLGLAESDISALRNLGANFVNGRGLGPAIGLFDTIKSLRQPETRAMLSRAIKAVGAYSPSTATASMANSAPGEAPRTAVPATPRPLAPRPAQQPQAQRPQAQPPRVPAPPKAGRPDHVSRQDRTAAETAQMKAWSMKPTVVQRQAPLVEDHRGTGFLTWILASIRGREL